MLNLFVPLSAIVKTDYHDSISVDNDAKLSLFALVTYAKQKRLKFHIIADITEPLFQHIQAKLEDQRVDIESIHKPFCKKEGADEPSIIQSIIDTEMKKKEEARRACKDGANEDYEEEKETWEMIMVNPASIQDNDLQQEAKRKEEAILAVALKNNIKAIQLGANQRFSDELLEQRLAAQPKPEPDKSGYLITSKILNRIIF